MKEFLILLTVSILLIRCENKPVPVKETGRLKKIDITVTPIAEPKIDLITNKNVKQRLLTYGSENLETVVMFYTDKGDIKVRLYKDTPLHRANFIMMVKKDCFNNTVFTRVVRDFMAQGGGTYEEENVELRNSIGKFTIPAEISRNHYHKKGSLAAARSYKNNPDKRSDPYAFYFVEGSLYNDLTLDKYESENNYTYSVEQREYYKSNPGAAHIDGEHTVFGEIIEGFDVIAKLTHVKTDGRDWPISDIYIQRCEVIE